MTAATTPAQYVLILIDLAQASSCDQGDLLAGTSLVQSGVEGIGARVKDEDFVRLVNNALRLTANPALGLDLGLRLNMSAHAVLGQAFMTCRDLGQIMELLMRYYHLLSPALHLDFEVLEERCVLTIISEPNDVPREFGYELVAAAVLNTLRELLNRPDLSLPIEMPYPPPPHKDRYHEVFGDNVRFDCVSGRISLDRDLLDLPLPASNPALRALYENECARLLADLEEEESVAEQTLRLLRKLEGQYPQMPQVAAMLNFSPRTYRRRLEAENQAYQALLDKVRAEHATRYLQNTCLPLATIAYQVGFNDTSNFRRAYLKWTGRSPRAVRNAS